MGKRGPKKGEAYKEMDDNEFEQLKSLCKIQCTGLEIQSVLNKCYNTINSQIKERTGKTFEQFRLEQAEYGKQSIRRKQFQMALEKDNTQVLLHLAKHHLGENDRQQTDINVNLQIDKVERVITHHKSPKVIEHINGYSED